MTDETTTDDEIRHFLDNATEPPGVGLAESMKQLVRAELAPAEHGSAVEQAATADAGRRTGRPHRDRPRRSVWAIALTGPAHPPPRWTRRSRRTSTCSAPWVS